MTRPQAERLLCNRGFRDIHRENCRGRFFNEQSVKVMGALWICGAPVHGVKATSVCGRCSMAGYGVYTAQTKKAARGWWRAASLKTLHTTGTGPHLGRTQ